LARFASHEDCVGDVMNPSMAVEKWY